MADAGTWPHVVRATDGKRILCFSKDAAAVDATKTFRHQDYELLCIAKALDTGKFAPALVVSKQVWPTRPRVIAVQRGDYLTEENAIDAAHVQGVEWIQNYG